MTVRKWLAAVLVLALVAALAALGYWVHVEGRYSINLHSSPKDEQGYPAYQLVSETRVSPYPAAVAVRLFVEDDADPRGATMLEPDGRLLSPAQRRQVESLLTKRTARNGSGHACFVPHHFFRYYDTQGQMIGQISVCFCCSGAAAWPVLFPLEEGYFDPAYNELVFDHPRLAAFVESLGLPANVQCRDRQGWPTASS